MSFSINFCASSSYFFCIIVEKYPYLMLICYFFSILFTSSSSSCCSAKTIWEYLEIFKLSSGVIESWGWLIYHLFGTDFLLSIFNHQLLKVVLLVLQQCSEYCIVISGMSTHFEISGCANNLVDGVQSKCKRKHWFLFYPFLWTYRETDYFRISCVLVWWLTISKS